MHKILLPVLLSLMALALAAPASALDGREIAERMDEVDNSKDASRKQVMVIQRQGKELVRKMEGCTKQYGENGKDEKSLIRFVYPPEVRDTMYLTWSYDDIDKNDDMWVYLPAENLVRRISGGGKKGSFMRSDLANEDIEDRSVNDDVQTLLREEAVGDMACWVVEFVPVKKKDTNYSKRVVWVHKEIFLPVRIDYYNKRGEVMKTMLQGEFKQIDGIWTATKMVMETPSKGSRTMMQMTDVQYDTGLSDTLFEQNSLKR